MLWYYTPMALSFSEHLKPLATVYDCMDELSAFKNAPLALQEREAELFERADLVFTGGQSLYEAKRQRHPRVYAFPSSVDATHFRQARATQQDPIDQAQIPHPRLGFYGVLDERLDLELLELIADAQPDWQLILIGPVIKIDPSDLPQRENIHYLGAKTLSGVACLSCRMGCCAASICMQRGYPFHQSHKDAGVPRGRQTRRVYPYP